MQEDSKLWAIELSLGLIEDIRRAATSSGMTIRAVGINALRAYVYRETPQGIITLGQAVELREELLKAIRRCKSGCDVAVLLRAGVESKAAVAARTMREVCAGCFSAVRLIEFTREGRTDV